MKKIVGTIAAVAVAAGVAFADVGIGSWGRSVWTPVAYDDADGKETNMNDDLRIAYVKQVLKWAHKAIEEGIELRGYYLWSLMDNFEWSAGYSARYGVYYTDFETLERSPKKSAKWYSTVTRDNGFEE